MKIIRLFFLCVLLSGALNAARGQRSDWVLTDNWFGRGSNTTRIFQVAGERWRVFCLNNGISTMRLRVFNRQHELVYEHQVGPNSSSIRTVPGGSGEYYLHIDPGGGSWEVSVRQNISRLQEWRLREEERDYMASLERTASFSGGPGTSNYSIEVPSGSWRVIYTNSRRGRLELELKGEADSVSNFERTMERPVRADTWIHHPGKYELKVNARETRWRVDFYGPRSPSESE